jgi:hypothetical protein
VAPAAVQRQDSDSGDARKVTAAAVRRAASDLGGEAVNYAIC